MFTKRNPSYQKAREKAAELLSGMTLEEKIIQLTQYIGNDNSYNPESKDESGSSNAGRCGSVLAVSGVENVNALQKIATEHTPHNIPIITGNDVIHGYRTTMPIPLGMSCTFEPETVRECFRVAGEEAKQNGVHWAYAPMVDVARDSRWGRVAEGFGEDPYLCSQMAAAAVHGYQDDAGIMACMKHFVAYSACEGGRDYNGCQLSDNELFNTFIPPFQAGVDAGVATFMSSFNEINGVPCSGNYHILTEVLRGKMGFDGFVVSDYDSVHELVNHGYAEDQKDAAEKGYGAGVDVVMSGNLYNKYLPELVHEGKIKEEAIDASALRVLAAKYLIGVMDEPFLDPTAERHFLTKENREVAYKAALHSLLLLENDGTLPLTKEGATGKKIGLCGPIANDGDSVLGCWSCIKEPSATITVKAAFENAYEGATVEYEAGVSFSKEKTSIDLAVQKMAKCDIIFIALGEHHSQSGEATSKTDLSLPSEQLELLDKISALGKPVVLIVSAGRPLLLAKIREKVNALIYIWAPGTECGRAVASVVDGEYNPAGRTTVSFPYSTGQLPLFYNHKRTGRPATGKFFESKYIDAPIGALYPFGYGLSYTSFEYTDVKLDKTSIDKDGVINVSLTVKNTGNFDGEDVVQLYVCDLAASVTRPVKELKKYKKLFVPAGASANISFELCASDLAFWNEKLEHVTESGKFKLWVAHHSDDNALEFDFEVI